jgi:hypothetical protein
MSKPRMAIAIACASLAAACATLKPQVRPEGPSPPSEAPARVVVVTRSPPAPPPPVKVRCVPKAFPRAPRYPDTDAALRDAGGAADRYQLMAAGRILRIQRLTELEKLVDACR